MAAEECLPRARARLRILVADSLPPCNLYQGSSLVGWHLFRRLRHHELTLICTAPTHELEYYQQILLQVFDRVYLVPRDTPVRMLASLFEPLLARTRVTQRTTGAAAASRYDRVLNDVVASSSFDVIHTRQLSTTAMTGPLVHPCKVLELIDSETLQAARRVRIAAPRTVLRAMVAPVLEGYAVRRFTACTTVSSADAQAVSKVAPGVPVHVIPNGVDATHFSPQPTREDRHTLVFTGAMSFSPNVTAVLDFYRRVLPLIRSEMPDVRLNIVGRDPAPEISALAVDPAVTVTGFVDDVRPWLARSSVMICPMITGSGIKNKVLEALAMRCAVVTTPLGAEALEAADGRELRIADGPSAFASAVVGLLRDDAERRRLGTAGRALVTRRYTWEACAANYERIYEDLLGRRRSEAPTSRLRSWAV